MPASAAPSIVGHSATVVRFVPARFALARIALSGAVLLTSTLLCAPLSAQTTVQAPSANGYVVDGQIDGLPDGKLQLRKVFDGTMLNETSAADGHFVFRKDAPFIGDKVRLVGNGIGQVSFYLEPGTITLRGNLQSISVAGTPSNDAQALYLRTIAPVEKRIVELKTELQQTKDPASRQALQKELDHQHSGVFYPLRKRFALEHNNTILAAEFLSAGTGQLTYTDMKALLAGLDPATPRNWYTNRLRERLEILRRTDLGQVAPDFTLPDPSGTPISLTDLRGSYVLVDFWASWCAPCRAENQNVSKLYAQYHDAGFDVISVSIDDNRAKWLKAIEEDKLPWHQVSSLTGWNCPVATQMGVAYGMSGIPYTLLLDREGRVIGHNVRGDALAGKLKTTFDSRH